MLASYPQCVIINLQETPDKLLFIRAIKSNIFFEMQAAVI